MPRVRVFVEIFGQHCRAVRARFSCATLRLCEALDAARILDVFVSIRLCAFAYGKFDVAYRESSCSGLLNIPPVSQESESSDEDEVEDIDPANADNTVDHDGDDNDKSAEVVDTKAGDTHTGDQKTDIKKINTKVPFPWFRYVR